MTPGAQTLLLPWCLLSAACADFPGEEEGKRSNKSKKKIRAFKEGKQEKNFRLIKKLNKRVKSELNWRRWAVCSKGRCHPVSQCHNSLTPLPQQWARELEMTSDQSYVTETSWVSADTAPSVHPFLIKIFFLNVENFLENGSSDLLINQWSYCKE